jgi:acyl-CoA hydrolase
MSDYDQLASDERIKETAGALQENGFSVEVVDSLDAAKQATLALLPKGASVFTATSKTLDEAGISETINTADTYEALRPKLMALMADPSTAKERKQLTGAIDYVIASAAAVTRDGKILVASGTGSQIAPEAYGADHVIYVIAAQKIVEDIADGIKRIETHVVPLESKRLQQVYGKPDIQTVFSRLFIYNRDPADRVHVILVKAVSGF